ncbi:MAG: glutathione S-transferase N-terminal domain-containing protein [Polyangiaceae bacterium]|nr:glutathione S-transferase N-terminal domain-containing protein [Polyangiaceae bacterium]
MKLYGHPMSTCTRKVLTVLGEKGHKADFVLVDITKGEQKMPDHLARQPFGVVPALDDDGFVLFESRAMCRYLDETLSGPKLTPDNAKDRARMEQWISVEHSYFTPAAMKILYQTLFAQMFGRPGDEGLLKEGREALAKPADVLEKHFAGGSDWLVGNQFTIADICYLPYIEYLFAAGQGDLITDRKHLASWWNRASERKSWRVAALKEQA